MKQYQVLGLIPARGGSKTVPRKNLKNLNGIPLIAHTILASKKSKIVNRLIVSTDDEEIAKTACHYGAQVPFTRPVELARDDTPDKPVIKHALEWLRNQQNFKPDFVVYLRPTTPFKTHDIIDSMVKMMIQTGADSVRSVTRVDGVFHPYWMFTKGKDQKALPVVKGVSIKDYYQRQLLPDVYRLNGVVDVLRSDVILNHEDLYGNDIRLFPVSESVSVDIDTQDDFDYCEFRLKKHANSGK